MIWNLLTRRQINWKISLNFCGLLRKPELYKNDEVFMSHFVVIMTQVKWAVLHCKKSQLYNSVVRFRKDFVGVKENVLDRIGRDMCSDWRLCSVVADLTFSGAASTGSAIYHSKKSLHDCLLLLYFFHWKRSQIYSWILWLWSPFFSFWEF